MNQVYTFVLDYATWITLGSLLLVLMILLVLIHKINVMKRKEDRVIKRVEDYLQVIMEEETQKAENKIKMEKRSEKQKGMDDEAKSHLISSVLQEIFP